MENLNEFLSSISFFQGLQTAEIEEISGIVRVRNCSKGEILFLEGDPGNGFYVVVSGRVKIYKESPEGKEIIIHICGPMDHFGQVAVYGGRTFPASAQAISGSTLLFLPRDEFRGKIAGNPDLALSMLASLSLRIRHVTTQLENLALKEVPGRLAAYLLYLQEKQSDSKTVSLAISRGELASLLGTTPETLSRILARLEDEGFMSVKKRSITIHDNPGLEELASRGRI